MKILKYFESFKKTLLEEIYKKYYSDILYDIFIKIVEADPTSKRINGLFFGKYCKWLLRLYKQNKLKLEDLYKATEYLQLFDRQSVRNKLEIKDILKIDSLPELAKLLESFKDNEEILSNKERKEKNLVAEFKNFKLYIPKTYEDSCLLGKGTEWCTATEKTRKYFDEYHKEGDELFIFISKKDPKEKYQLHIGSEQFKDKFDEETDIVNFMEENQDIKKWFENNEKYKDSFNFYFKLSYVIKNNIELEDLTFFNFDNNKVYDTIIISYLKIKSLKGAPKKCKVFKCSHCNLETLEGAPEECEEFYCFNNINLKSLKGAPKKCNFFDCSECDLISLKGAPEECDEFYCIRNKNLTSLIGAPKKCKIFDCSYCNLTSLEGAPEECEEFYCFNNINLKSLKGAPKKM